MVRALQCKVNSKAVSFCRPRNNEGYTYRYFGAADIMFLGFFFWTCAGLGACGAVWDQIS